MITFSDTSQKIMVLNFKSYPPELSVARAPGPQTYISIRSPFRLKMKLFDLVSVWKFLPFNELNEGSGSFIGTILGI